MGIRFLLNYLLQKRPLFLLFVFVILLQIRFLVSAYSTENIDSKYLLNKGDLVIGMDGNFHINYWSDDISYLNQRSVRLRALNDSNVSIIQARLDIEPYIEAKEARAKGSTVGHLSDKDMKELYIMVSTNYQVRNNFDVLLDQILLNRNEIISLTKQRDQLLPLLMNGQVSVNSDLSACINLIIRAAIRICIYPNVSFWSYLRRVFL